MSLKSSSLLVAALFGAFGAFHGLEKGPGSELLPIVPQGQNTQIRLLPGSTNPVTEEITLEPNEDAGTVQISVQGGDVDLGGVRTSGGTIHIDQSWPPNAFLDSSSNPLDSSVVDHFKTIVDDSDESSAPYPFPNFHVAINETSTGYDLYILFSKNGIRIPIKT